MELNGVVKSANKTEQATKMIQLWWYVATVKKKLRKWEYFPDFRKQSNLNVAAEHFYQAARLHRLQMTQKV